MKEERAPGKGMPRNGGVPPGGHRDFTHKIYAAPPEQSQQVPAQRETREDEGEKNDEALPPLAEIDPTWGTTSCSPIRWPADAAWPCCR